MKTEDFAQIICKEKRLVLALNLRANLSESVILYVRVGEKYTYQINKAWNTFQEILCHYK